MTFFFFKVRVISKFLIACPAHYFMPWSFFFLLYKKKKKKPPWTAIIIQEGVKNHLNFLYISEQEKYTKKKGRQISTLLHRIFSQIYEPQVARKNVQFINNILVNLFRINDLIFFMKGKIVFVILNSNF